MIARTILIAALAAAATAVAGAALAQSFTQAAPGKQLFDAQCVDCHGINGTGDEAPAINHPLSVDDAALHKIIRDGTPDGRMPRVRRMTEEEVDQLVAYVRVLGRGASTPITGNAQRGNAAYQRLGCATCHVIGGQGGVLGPDLTKVGQRRSGNYLRQVILEPGKVKPKGSTGILLNGFSEYLPVSVVERNGREVRGIRVNEDSFTIQVRDSAGTLYSFRKTDVQNVDKQFGRSLMPGYKDKLSAAETDDLVAYLASLGVAK
jgi:putative heme-binding domain-containing protein